MTCLLLTSFTPFKKETRYGATGCCDLMLVSWES